MPIQAFSSVTDGLESGARSRGHFIANTDIDNEHPEVSFASLWSKVWYENYSQPEYVWQSSASSNEFEPKFSLTPLAFGTLKAALYAMFFALPLALMGAIVRDYSKRGDLICDPCAGMATTAVAADMFGRLFVGAAW